MKALRVGLAISIITTALAGLYFVVYLYRWEMHRAISAGVVFLAGEIALATSLVLRRIEVLRRQPNATATPVTTSSDSSTAVVAPPSSTTSGPAPYPWLGTDRFGVFVPILLGAGAIVSGVAWVVEHLAKATVGQGRPGRLERRLALLAPPAHGFVGAGPTRRPDDAGAPRTPPLGWLGQATVALLVGGLVVVLVTLALLGRSRPDPPTHGMHSHIIFELRTRNGLDVDLASRSLWEACHATVPAHEAVELRPLSPPTYLLVLDPALGEQAARRFLGCLNDGTLEMVHADLRGHTRVPAPTA